MGCDLSAPGEGRLRLPVVAPQVRGLPAEARLSGSLLLPRPGLAALSDPQPRRPVGPLRAGLLTVTPRSAALGCLRTPRVASFFSLFSSPPRAGQLGGQEPGRPELIREPRRRVQAAQPPSPAPAPGGARGRPGARRQGPGPIPTRGLTTCPPRLGRWGRAACPRAPGPASEARPPSRGRGARAGSSAGWVSGYLRLGRGASHRLLASFPERAPSAARAAGLFPRCARLSGPPASPRPGLGARGRLPALREAAGRDRQGFGSSPATRAPLRPPGLPWVPRGDRTSASRSSAGSRALGLAGRMGADRKSVV